MYEHPLEDVYRLIDTIERAISDIDSSSERTIDVEEVPELSEVILELLGWTNTAYMENKLGINPALLSKFIKMRGTVQRHLARKVADRLRSYLKSQDQTVPERNLEPTPKPPPKREPKPTRDDFAAEQWIAVKTSSEIKMKIGAISALLDSIIIQTKGSNEPPEQQLLTEIERQQLIAVLETALNILRSPLVERGLLKKARSILRKGSESAAEKGVQQGLGKLMESAGARIAELIGLLFS
jgi:hypothetical protein